MVVVSFTIYLFIPLLYMTKPTSGLFITMIKRFIMTNQAPITRQEVMDHQAAWGTAIKQISAYYRDNQDYVGIATKASLELYGFDNAPVMFKPTKAVKYPFRPTSQCALSYFVGGKAVGGHEEDGGFVINNGKGWRQVEFDNHIIETMGTVAIAMGTYNFECATTNQTTAVHYTFGYRRNPDGKVVIFLHHSSVPYRE